LVPWEKTMFAPLMISVFFTYNELLMGNSLEHGVCLLPGLRFAPPLLFLFAPHIHGLLE
jgi:hypothetical protein